MDEHGETCYLCKNQLDPWEKVQIEKTSILIHAVPEILKIVVIIQIIYFYFALLKKTTKLT